MMGNNTMADEVVFYDTEYTSWDGSLERDWSEPWEEKEIVQIGAAILNFDDLMEVGAINLFIKPVINPELSDYFTQLTGITQQQVCEHGIDVKTGVKDFKEFVGNRPAYSWGGDRRVVNQNLDLRGIGDLKLPQDQYRDIRSWALKNGIPAELNSGELAGHYDLLDQLPDNGEDNHNALYDARSILVTIRHLIKNGAELPA
jgi:inhibitor of KinA sporulation pathway (predicted exonuclease)